MDKKITNEQKAKELCNACPNCTFSCGDRLNCKVEDKYNIAMEMARWKDEQHEKEKQQWLGKVYDDLKLLLDPDSLMVVQHKLLDLVYPMEIIE